ncbi:hypothetical protein GP420_002549, partial [Enterococcus faecalis]|nr:hypothetical protein [Enterococcus faecalis]
NSIEKRKIAYFLVIFRLRNVQKHSITTDDYPTLEEYSFLTFKETCRCIDFFTTYNNNELSFLFDLFKGFNWVQDIYLCYEEERSINSQAAIQTDNFIELYEKHWFSIDAMYYTEAVSYIYSIHKLVGIAPNLEIDLNGNYYGRYLQFHFPNLYKEIKKFIDLLAKRTNSELFNAYNFLAVNYTMLFYYLEKQCYYEEKIIILLETEMPKIVNLQYKKKIEEALREFYNINVLLAGEVGPLDTVNLIVTTMSIDSLTKDYGRVPTILISREITLYDISMIQKAIGKL